MDIGKVVNTPIGRFRVAKALGRGGMGGVDLVENTETGEFRVIKTTTATSPHLLDHIKIKERFQREFGLLQRLGDAGAYYIGTLGTSSANEGLASDGATSIVAPTDQYATGTVVGEDATGTVRDFDPPQITGAIGKKELFYVSDFVRGETLERYLDEREKRGININEQLDTKGLVSLLQTSEAIAKLHNGGIIHRDIKPANIMLPGIARLIDFGLGKHKDDVGLTGENIAMGTVQYMPPEQHEEGMRNVDYKSDVYSLGVILYEILTGRKPFQDVGNLETLYSRKLNPEQWVTLPSIANPDAGISSELDRLVMDSLNANQSKRPTAKSLGVRLSGILKQRYGNLSIGGYDIINGLGRDGSVIRYLGKSEKGDYVEVQVLKPGSVGEVSTKFWDRNNRLKRLRHPNLITHKAAGNLDEGNYLVSELQEGWTFADELEVLKGVSQDVYLRRIAYICERVATALDYCAGQGFVPEDFDSDQIIINSKDEPKVVLTGVTKSDVQGAYIYSQLNLATIVYSLIGENQVPERVNEVLIRALLNNVGERYSSCGEFASAFRKALPSQMEVVRLDSLQSVELDLSGMEDLLRTRYDEKGEQGQLPAPSRVSRWRWPAVALGTAVVVLALGASYMFLSGPGTSNGNNNGNGGNVVVVLDPVVEPPVPVPPTVPEQSEGLEKAVEGEDPQPAYEFKASMDYTAQGGTDSSGLELVASEGILLYHGPTNPGARGRYLRFMGGNPGLSKARFMEFCEEVKSNPSDPNATVLLTGDDNYTSNGSSATYRFTCRDLNTLDSLTLYLRAIAPNTASGASADIGIRLEGLDSNGRPESVYETTETITNPGSQSAREIPLITSPTTASHSYRVRISPQGGPSVPLLEGLEIVGIGK